MSKLVWDKIGECFYETGADHAVLCLLSAAGAYDRGVAWNGITDITEGPSGAEPNNIHADNVKYLVLMSAGGFGLTIEAYMHSDEWEECDGPKEITPGVVAGQQTHKVFGLSYRIKLGNDVDGQDHDYKLHLAYGGLASPSERGYQSVNDSPEPINPSWEAMATPVDVPDFKSTACLIVVFTKADLVKLKVLKDILYGTEETEPRLPLPEEVIKLLVSDVMVAVVPESPPAVLLSKKAPELQSNVAVDESATTGSPKSVTGHTGFSSDPSGQKGHYLALKFDVTPTGAAATVELVGGTKGSVALDEDRNIVLLIKNNSQSVEAISIKDSFSVAKIYTLTGLALEP